MVFFQHNGPRRSPLADPCLDNGHSDASCLHLLSGLPLSIGLSALPNRFGYPPLHFVEPGLRLLAQRSPPLWLSAIG